MTIAALQAALPYYPLPPSFGLPFDLLDFGNHGLRDYQSQILAEVVDKVRHGYRKILVQLPTGGGKTRLAAALLGTASHAQFIVHRKELIDQTSEAFRLAGLGHSFIAADRTFDQTASVFLCGIVTLAERLGISLPPEIIILDEAHHGTAATWAKVIRANPNALIIGLTATPQRLDGKGLDEHFETMVLGPSVKWLIANRYLSDFDYYAPPPGTDDEAALIGDVVEHYMRLAPGEPGLVFASNRAHGKDLTLAFRAAGVPTVFMDGTMNTAQREKADQLFRSGARKILVSVNLVGEGYDVPNVVYCGIARRTQSLSWYLQMVGRVLRPVYGVGMPTDSVGERALAIMAGGKHKAIICDHGNNWFSHGMPDDDRPWVLTGKLRGSGAGCNMDADPIHQCMTCYMITPSSMKQCPGCATEFPAVTRNIRFKEGYLTKIERDEIREQKKAEKQKATMLRKAEEREARSEIELINLGKKRGYPNAKNWAKNVLARRAAWKGR